MVVTTEAGDTVSNQNTEDRKPVGLIERIKIGCIAELGYWVILLIGRSLRWRTEGEHYLEEIHRNGNRFIAVSWHNRIFLTSYFFRKRKIVGMISQSREGEYIARVSRRLGNDIARGSSSRGSRGAVVEILRALKRKQDVFIALDGPRGPRYIAKPGAAYIARKSGNPLLPFCFAVEKKWVVRSWDGFIVPMPFSRAMIVFEPSIKVDSNADESEMKRVQERIQLAMDRLCDRCDSYWDA